MAAHVDGECPARGGTAAASARAAPPSSSRRRRRRRYCNGVYLGFLVFIVLFGFIMGALVAESMGNRRGKVVVMVLCPLTFVFFGACMFHMEWTTAVINHELEMMV
uniref:Uncharacterized protein n=1 Tax=Oryza nivara TaxID=4536 RepID=A0A0E0I4I4_ORYNI